MATLITNHYHNIIFGGNSFFFTHCCSSVASSPGPQTFGQRTWGNLGRGFPLTGTRGMKWLCPLLLQAMTMGALSFSSPLESFVEHSAQEDKEIKVTSWYNYECHSIIHVCLDADAVYYSTSAFSASD